MRCASAVVLVVCGFVGLALLTEIILEAGPTGAAAFHVEPRHLKPTADGVTIVWSSKHDEAGAVEYGVSDRLGYRVEEEAIGQRHSVRLEGLKPATAYYYRVRSGDHASSIFTFETGPMGAGFHVEPYLQLPTPSGMTVMWETTQPLDGSLEFGSTAELGRVLHENKPAARLHQIRIDGLTPGSTCYYRVRSGELVSKVNAFRTAPPPGTGKWRMAVYGDSRSNPFVHRKVAEQIARANVDLIVHTGDIVLNGKNYDLWRLEFFAPIAPIAGSVPWVSTIGNHEQDADNYFSYMALPGNERYFSFDYGNAHIVCIDSNGWIERGRDSKQYQWIESDLKAPRDSTWTFVAFHHPLFSAHRDRGINPLRWDWAPLFLDPKSRVDGVLTGHDHFYARNHLMAKVTEGPQQGTLFLTTAGGGASLYPLRQRDYIAAMKSVHHFTLFDFDGDQVTITPIDITGKAFDRSVLKKTPTSPDDLCAFEVEELKEYLRRALVVAHPVEVRASGAQVIDTTLEVPTRFQVPVSGVLRWSDCPGWELKSRETHFTLQPRQPLVIPLQATVTPGALTRSPLLTIEFAPGRFRNRKIEVYPFKVTGPAYIDVGRRTTVLIDGQIRDDEWNPSPALPLLGMQPLGSEPSTARVAFDGKNLCIAGHLQDPARQARVSASGAGKTGSKLVLSGEHVRVELSDSGPVQVWALSPEQILYHSVDGKDAVSNFQARAGSVAGAWTAELAIPLQGLDRSKLRINIIHRSREATRELTLRTAYREFELRPGFGLGSNPDLIPDWKSTSLPGRFAHVKWAQEAAAR